LRQLNGWQRLWVLVISLIGVFAITVFIVEYPNNKKIEEKHSQAMAEISAEEVKGQKFVTFRDKEGVMHHDGFILTTEYIAKRRQIEHQEYSRGLEELSAQRWSQFWHSLVAWVLASTALYVFGWLVAWVIQGFKSAK